MNGNLPVIGSEFSKKTINLILTDLTTTATGVDVDTIPDPDVEINLFTKTDGEMPVNGDMLICYSATGNGITQNLPYYVINVSGSTFQLTTTKTSSSAIDITSTFTSEKDFYYYKKEDLYHSICLPANINLTRAASVTWEVYTNVDTPNLHGLNHFSSPCLSIVQISSNKEYDLQYLNMLQYTDDIHLSKAISSEHFTNVNGDSDSGIGYGAPDTLVFNSIGTNSIIADGKKVFTDNSLFIAEFNYVQPANNVYLVISIAKSIADFTPNIYNFTYRVTWRYNT